MNEIIDREKLCRSLLTTDIIRYAIGIGNIIMLISTIYLFFIR